MKISYLIKHSSEFKPLEYLLTLPPMNKIKATSEDGTDYFEIEGNKGLYDYGSKENLTIKELIRFIPNSKYRFEIEFEKEKQEDLVEQAIRIRKIYERTKNSELLDKIKELEKEIAKNAEKSYEYAFKIKRRFELGEPTIAKDAPFSYAYARVLRKRFPLGEPEIAKAYNVAFEYARNIIKGRWKPGEAAIKKDKGYHEAYLDFLKGIDSLPESSIGKIYND